MAVSREAMYWKARDDQVIRCVLCPFMCVLKEGEVGNCRVRRNEGGKLVALTYAQIASAHVDPIEKKPLYHFYPGSNILSLGTWGCNLHCQFCQNWQISQQQVPTKELRPEEAVDLAQNRDSNIGIAYTYNEPVIWYEYVLDTSRLAHEAGLKNVLVTNGQINPQPLEELLPHIDALNIDVKGMRGDFYERLCGGKLRPVLRTAELAQLQALVEITNLIIPGENDSDGDLQALVDWVAEKLGPETPLHFSRYHPDYQFTRPATPLDTLQRAYDLAREKLHFVYVGNAHLPGTNDTYCPHCGARVISRVGFDVVRLEVRNGVCQHCQGALNVIQ